MNNPLASRAASREAPDQGMLRHAQMWKGMQAQDSDTLQQHVQSLDYGLPIMGALAGNPKTTAKDVIKATSQAVADQKMSPSQGVAFISQMPAEADKLQPWLREKYALNLAAAVHAKAALLARAQPQQAPQVAPPGMAPTPVAGGMTQ